MPSVIWYIIAIIIELASVLRRTQKNYHTDKIIETVVGLPEYRFDSNNSGQRSKSKDVTEQNKCNRNQWMCKNGNCISRNNLCDGSIECADESDETFEACKSIKCENYLFQCDYGACIDNDFECDGVKNCADNSDEKRCLKNNQPLSKCSEKQFLCDNGECINKTLRCDGQIHCADGSDETFETCRMNQCETFLFRCDYGACVDGDAACNGKVECADSSDENGALCLGKKATSKSPIGFAPKFCPAPDMDDYDRLVCRNPQMQKMQCNNPLIEGSTIRMWCANTNRIMKCVNGSWDSDMLDCSGNKNKKTFKLDIEVKDDKSVDITISDSSPIAVFDNLVWKINIINNSSSVIHLKDDLLEKVFYPQNINDNLIQNQSNIDVRYKP